MAFEIILPNGDKVGNRSQDVPLPVNLKSSDGNILDISLHSGHVRNLGYLEAIGHGISFDSDVLTKLAVGKQSNIGTGAYRIVESSPFVQPGGDTQMYLQSTSAQDSAGGTGIKELIVEYFENAWGTRKQLAVVPNGINQVTFSTANMYRIHSVYGIDGQTADGDISITNQAESVLYGQIDQYETFMRRCIFYLAQNERLTLVQAIVSSTTAGGVNLVAFVTEQNSPIKTITRGRATVGMKSNSLVVEFKPWITITNPDNLRKAVGISANGDLSNQKATVTALGFVETI